jgi:hypothetical protein
MPLAALCPHCSAKIKVPDAAAGKMAACPKCKQPFAAPEPLQAVESLVPAAPDDDPLLTDVRQVVTAAPARLA